MKVYICDQQKECSSSYGCAKNGGECSHTTDRNHGMKFPQCATCDYRVDTTWSYENCICQKCEDTDPVYHLEPPTNWKYEDSEGELK